MRDRLTHLAAVLRALAAEIAATIRYALTGRTDGR